MGDLVFFLIDDDEDDQDIFAIALEQSNIQSILFTAANGTEALEKFNADATFLPDFIFLDLNMPGMHGTVCLEEIKKMHRLSSIPVIIYSTSSNPVFEKQTKALGASHYLIKPYNIDWLSRMLWDIAKNKNLPFSLGAKTGENFL